MSKKSWIALVVLLVVIAALASVFLLTRKPADKENTETTANSVATQAAGATGTETTGATGTEATQAKYQFTLEIVHKDGQKKTLSVATNEEILGEYLEKEGIIEGAEGPYGMYIAKVEGEKAVYEEDNAYWAFYVDGEYASTGVDQTNIENGKVYQLKYEPAF